MTPPLIAHTTDLSGEDEIAFVHAVALAARSHARLASVHACVGAAPERELPDARPLVRKWQAEELPEHQRILHQCCDDATDTLLDALRRLEPALVVAATHARTGLGRVLAGSVAEGVARNVSVPTLLLPLEGRGFADRGTGAVRLECMLVPAGDAEEARAGVEAAVRLAEMAGAERGKIILLHVEDGRPPPDVSVAAPLTIERRAAKGSLESAVLETAREVDACVVVMATRGHDGIGDVVFGSHTERVLHGANRPVLWVPIRKKG